MDRGIVMMKGDAGLWTSGTYSMQALGGGIDAHTNLWSQ